MRGELTVTYGTDELPRFIKKHLKRDPRGEKGAINGHRQDLEPREGGYNWPYSWQEWAPLPDINVAAFIPEK